ncbi:DNA phosphorothioation-dependent restriction protein DptF [Motilimonas cestriensis]|uniref:DNA phosphorothioation-dependent restriction protein DptF n=1 Tax=Motilimonas cestriensis TaxID=2742685 RepID=A0ABS8W8X3_9GAMM|nr:DNA phosphorothioation-dependent restriction protein DptF [Motilimonas cestriensis]MCE2594925.1 DNA phosphorothioation-dependent restriction protein DptF [Motilimonas cestriensis]
MRLKEALSVLSKSSPYAVSTERDSKNKNQLDDVKEYLYIKMPIAIDVEKKISSFSSNKPEVLFLCGSSGDGKSEILTDCKKRFSNRAHFHLDATHSFDPRENAIQTLDKVFDEFESGTMPLIVGINTGMLGNYAEEGSNEKFKDVIKNYLSNNISTEDVTFINFEDYPKFFIGEGGYTSEFAQKLLQKLTANDDNIIRQIFDKEKLEQTSQASKRLQANYEILCIPEVQKNIIVLLFKARLIRDQFLTARALLDFVFMLLAGPGYLFDNIFSGGDNELANKVIEFDPAHLRTKKIDRFILANDLHLPDQEFSEFKECLKILGVESLESSLSYLRLFYIIKGYEFSNNYHSKFEHDFNETLIEQYVTVYQLHRDFNGSLEHKKQIKLFYNNTIRSAIRKYNNRNAPNLDKNHYLISELNGFQLVSKLDVKADIKSISNFSPKSSASFTAFINVQEHSLAIPVNINLLHLMERISDGYRPNKHDKNTVVLLDELIDEIAQVANKVATLHIIKESKHFTIKNVDNEEFEVSGL